jgi:hypothetical protein
MQFAQKRVPKMDEKYINHPYAPILDDGDGAMNTVAPNS